MGVFQTVANWVLGDYKVRTTQATDGAQLQHVRLDVGAGTAESQVTAANPLPVSAVGTGSTNIAQYGGVATTLGQKAKTASIPVVLATEQDTSKGPDAVGGYYVGTGTWDPINETWTPTLNSNGTPIGHVAQNATADWVSIPVKAAAPGASDEGVVTRNIPSGIQTITGDTATDLAYIGANPVDFFVDTLGNGHGYIPGGGYNDDTLLADTLHLKKSDPVISDAGVITRNIPSGTQNVSPAAPTITGTITTATSTITLNPISGYGGVCVSVSGTYTGVNFLLEGSRDGTSWSTISMSQQTTPAIQQATGVIASITRQWIAPTLGCIAVRVRATAWVSGTANITINGSLAAVPTAVQTIPSGTQTVSGAVTVTGSVSLVAAKAAGGASHYRNIDLNNTGILIQTAQTYVSSVEVFNTTGATIFLKIYNKATAATSADTPIKTIPIAAGRERDITSAIGWNLSLGYSVRCVTGVADADTTSPAANGCVFSTTYT